MKRFVPGEGAAVSVYALTDDGLVALGGPADGPAVVLVPTEQVLLLATPLPPLQGTVRRRNALPFAIEDRIADPIDQVHVALGREMAPGVWLSGVVAHDVMRAWVALLGSAGLDGVGLEQAMLVPDALTLPVPAPAHWSIEVNGTRVAVRRDDGSGFALPLAQFDAAWRLAGSPTCVVHGDPLPAQFDSAGFATTCDGPHLSAMMERLRAPDLDLRQGIHAAPRRPVSPLWKRIALVAGLGALAQGAIAVADTLTLTHLAHQREAQVRTLARTLQPSLVIGADMGDALSAMTPDAAGTRPGAFVPLLSRTAAALSGSHVAANWRSVAYDQAAGTLTIELETAEIADVQAIAQALTRAGFSAQQGSASSENGRAIGSFVIRAS